MTITMNINFNQSPADPSKGQQQPVLPQPTAWQPPYLQGNSYNSSKHLTSSDYSMHQRDPQKTFHVSKNRVKSLEGAKQFAGSPPQITRTTPGIVIDSRGKKAFS